MQIKQNLKTAQQLTMTQELQASIQLLLLTRAEMELKVEEALIENPLLEISEDFLQDSTKNDEFDSKEEIPAELQLKDLISKGDSPSLHPTLYQEDSEATSPQDRVATIPTLLEYLEEQILFSAFTQKEQQIAYHICGNLDQRGYLKNSLEELVDECNIEDYDYRKDKPNLLQNPPISINEVQIVLNYIHEHFEPIGIAAKDLPECLAIQIVRKNQETAIEDLELVIKIIYNDLSLLETKNLKKIAKNNKVELERVLQAVNLILSLEPIPARNFDYPPDNFIIPDIYIDKIDGVFIPRLNNSGIPQLQLSNHYLNMVHHCDAETKAYILEKARNARYFIDSIHERQNTIFKVTQSIIKFQHGFFEYGPTHLKPLILKDIAQDISMHESTISRVTSNKYVETPHGLFELKYFFSSGISNAEGEDFASEKIKIKIQEIITQENRIKPLSDAKIASLLQQFGMDVSRRTVAKYRESLGILASSQRKQIS